MENIGISLRQGIERQIPCLFLCVERRNIPIICRQKGEKMAEIKLFDTWTFQEQMPEPFSQFLQKEG